MKKVHVVVSYDISTEIYKTLENLDFKPISSCKVLELDKNISRHPDLQIKRLGDKYLVADNCYDFYMEKTKTLGIKTSLFKAGASVFSPYPSDCLLNVETFGKKLLKGDKTPNLPDFKCYQTVTVKQGYVGCSVLKLNENAAVTEDVGIACALSDIGVDVLLLDRGSVSLSGASCGFIGGAGFVFNKTACFFGDIKSHPQFDSISAFLSKHRTKYLSLSSEKLTDYGKAVPLF